MTEAPARQRYTVTLAVLAIAALSYALLQTMVAPALPQIQHDLGVSTSAVTWVLTIYLLTASIATPVIGRLGDMYGKERLLVITLAIFAVGAAVSALSHTLGLLVAGRAIQGIGGAVFPLAFGIIRDEFPREKVASGLGLISATFGIGGGGGLVLSGLIVDNLAWEWIFWLGFAVIVIAMVATYLFVPESPIKAPARIDWTGAGLLSVGLSSLLLAVAQGNSWGWGSTRVIGLLVLSAVVLTAWVRIEARTREPLVDMQMMRRRGVWTTNLTALLVGFGMFGSFILIPQFVQASTAAGYGFGASVTGAGLIMLPSTVVMLFAGPLSGVLSTRLGSRVPLMAGTLLASAAFVLLARPLREVGGARCHRADGRRNRACVCGDGEPDRGGRAAHRDGCRHGHEHDHADGRRRAGRAGGGDDRVRAGERLNRARCRERLHGGIRGLSRRAAAGVRRHACDPEAAAQPRHGARWPGSGAARRCRGRPVPQLTRGRLRAAAGAGASSARRRSP